VQNRVRPEKVYDAFYKLSDPMQQIQAYVEQVILGDMLQAEDQSLPF